MFFRKSFSANKPSKARQLVGRRVAERLDANPLVTKADIEAAQVYYHLDFLDAALESWGVRVVVAIDVRGGHVSVSGWTKTTQMRAEDVIARMQARGVRQFVYTNADRDGMLNGPDIEEVRSIAEVIRGRFIYSGGISSLDDLRALKELRLVNLAGVISGKALYEGRFTIEEAQELLKERTRVA